MDANTKPGAERGENEAPSKWRKKPVVVEAWQYDGPQVVEVHDDRVAWNAPEFERLRKWVGSKFTAVVVGSVTHGGPNQHAPAIRTLEGVMRVMPGDWVIKGVRGEFYPCKPSIFDATYEAVPSGKGVSE